MIRHQGLTLKKRIVILQRTLNNYSEKIKYSASMAPAGGIKRNT